MPTWPACCEWEMHTRSLEELWAQSGPPVSGNHHYYSGKAFCQECSQETSIHHQDRAFLCGAPVTKANRAMGTNPELLPTWEAQVSLWWKAKTSLSLTSPYTQIRTAYSQQPWAHSHVTWFDKLCWPRAQLPIRIYKAQRLLDNFSLSRRAVMVQNGDINTHFKHTYITLSFPISPRGSITSSRWQQHYPHGPKLWTQLSQSAQLVYHLQTVRVLESWLTVADILTDSSQPGLRFLLT